MSGLAPTHLTGANAKIKLDTTVIAYATNVSYSVNVATVPIEVIGKYEIIAHEPTAYMVEGTLSIIRYVKEAGNNGNTTDKMGAVNHFNPASLLISTTFDLEILQKIKLNTNMPAVAAVAATATTAAVTAADAYIAEDLEARTFIKLTNCRFTRKSGGLDKRGVLSEQYSFVAILAIDEKGIDVAVPFGV